MQALALSPQKGVHMLYSNLSAAYLQLGRQEEALQAAKASVDTAPKGFHMVRMGVGQGCDGLQMASMVAGRVCFVSMH